MKFLGLVAIASTCLSAPMAQIVGRPAVCTLEAGSIVGHSASGVPQVSNLGNIRIRCSVPARQSPSKPGESLYGLGANAVAHDVSNEAAEPAFAAVVSASGGGTGDGRDYVLFALTIPLKPADLDEEAHRYLKKFMETAKAFGPVPELATVEAQQRILEVIRERIHQNRTGHFLVECHVTDGNTVIGTGTVDLEVLFKGRFSDDDLPGAPPA